MREATETAAATTASQRQEQNTRGNGNKYNSSTGAEAMNRSNVREAEGEEEEENDIFGDPLTYRMESLGNVLAIADPTRTTKEGDDGRPILNANRGMIQIAFETQSKTIPREVLF